MTRYAIDPPTLVHIVDHALVVSPTHQIVAPNSVRSQALQLLLDDVRRGARTEKDALAMHERITEVKMRLLGDRVSRAVSWRIARERDWSTLHHAEYLAVARLQADALVTVDAQLAQRADGIVATAPVEALCAG